MIIRTTFNDNDFTHLLEEYWDGFWYKNYYCILDKYEKSDDYEDLKKHKEIYIEFHDLLDKAFFEENKMTVEELKRFERVITESIFAFIESKRSDSIDYLKKMFSVKIRFRIEDKWENGEVVYYFLNHKKMITM